MPHVGNDGPGFRPLDRQVSAQDLNRMKAMVPRQVSGSDRIVVTNVGGRVIISQRTQRRVPSDETANFVVIDEFEDVLECAFFSYGASIQTHDPALDPSIIPGYGSHIYVAKPRLLQQTPFDGQVVLNNGVQVTYEYTGIGQRTATGTINSEDIEEQHVVIPGYFPGDIITARQAPSGFTVTIIEPEAEDRVFGVFWIDLNEGGRQWAVVDEE